MGDERWSNLSLPASMVESIDKIKPKWMSRAEFVRNAINYYIDEKFPKYNAPLEVPADGV